MMNKPTDVPVAMLLLDNAVISPWSVSLKWDFNDIETFIVLLYKYYS